MLRLLERNIRCVEERLVLLAPPQAKPRSTFNNVERDADEHRRLLHETQRLRGNIYADDGAVPREQLSGGLHKTREDDRSWHLLMLNRQREVSACVWYLEHPNTTRPQQLRVRDTPLAKDAEWREPLSKAVDSELARARRNDMTYAEVGGWAVTKESRCTSEGLLLALTAYSLGRMLGGALGITTATVRHSSSTILRRIGGSSLEADGEAIPSYYDPKYGCEMELLRFDSRRPNSKFAGLVDLLESKLADVQVLSPRPAVSLVPACLNLWEPLVHALFTPDVSDFTPSPAIAIAQ